MKLLIDATRYVIEGAGISRYTKNIAAELGAAKGIDCRFLVTFARKDALKVEKLNFLKKFGDVELHRLPGACKEFCWRSSLSGALFRRWYRNADLFFAPSFLEVPNFLNLPLGVMIHDMTTARFPSQRGKKLSARLTALSNKAASKADVVFTPSVQTKKDVVKYAEISPAKVTVTPLAPEPLFHFKNRKRQKFILTVGTIEPRKNIQTIVRAYDLLPQRLKREYKLVIVGGRGWNDTPIWKTLKKYQRTNQLQVLGYVNEEKLADLYNRASVFVYVPLFEGFGLPLIEAMGCGAPTITASNSSLPEVGGDAAVYLHDERSPEVLADLLAEVLQDDKLRQVLSKKSLRQAQKFSWRKTGDLTLQALKKVYEKK